MSRTCSGLAPNMLGCAGLILPIAAGAVVLDTVVSTRVQLDTREDMRGRVLAALGMTSSLPGLSARRSSAGCATRPSRAVRSCWPASSPRRRPWPAGWR
ncbi:hypothetical protein [Paractinoplanes globisporus]|uniref:Uncharacterized protein n=1 Tax=Paractinoplanes globisporus TaxID=113565 RepID=A0ABW6WGI4_9ACTN|nr:hypothetical protein [Actinoplanes globisporus]